MNSYLQNWDNTYNNCKKIRDFVLKNKDIPNLKGEFKALLIEHNNAKAQYKSISNKKNRLEILHYANMRLITALTTFIAKINPQLLRASFSELELLAEEYYDAFKSYHANNLLEKFHFNIQSFAQTINETKSQEIFTANLLIMHQKLLRDNKEVTTNAQSIQNYLNQLLSNENIVLMSKFLDILDTTHSRISIIKKNYITYQSNEEKAYTLFKLLMKQYEEILNPEFSTNKLLKYYQHFMKELSRNVGNLQKGLIIVTRRLHRLFKDACKEDNIQPLLELIQEKHNLLSKITTYLTDITSILNSSTSYKQHTIDKALQEYFYNSPIASKKIFSTINSLNSTYLKQYYSIKQSQIKEVMLFEYQILVYLSVLQYGVNKLTSNKALLKAYITIIYYKMLIFNDNQDSLLYKENVTKLNKLLYSKDIEKTYHSFNKKLLSNPKKLITKQDQMLSLIDSMDLLNYNLLISATYLKNFFKTLQIELTHISKKSYFNSYKQIGRFDIDQLIANIYTKGFFGEKGCLPKLDTLTTTIDPQLAKTQTQNLRNKYIAFLNLVSPQQKASTKFKKAA